MQRNSLFLLQKWKPEKRSLFKTLLFSPIALRCPVCVCVCVCVLARTFVLKACADYALQVSIIVVISNKKTKAGGKYWRENGKGLEHLKVREGIWVW